MTQIKLKVHKDAADLQRDANRESLLQFLNSTYEWFAYHGVLFFY